MDAVAVDLGGTNLRAARISEDGTILKRAETPTEAQSGVDNVVSRIVGVIREAMGGDRSSVSGVGVGFAAPLDAEKGVVLQAPNLKGWINIPLGEKLKSALSMPVVVENDANAAALGEFWIGAGKNVQSLVCLTLGTGIGGGVVIGGEIWRGAGFLAGEFGHTVLREEGEACPCGSRGCIERYGSASALQRFARKAIDAHPESLLAKSYADCPDDVSARSVTEHAKQGDEVSLDLLRDHGKVLGIAAANVANFLNPEVIVFGGGLILAGDLLFGPLQEEYEKRALAAAVSSTRIVKAEVGPDAGLIGAAKALFDRVAGNTLPA